MIIRRLFLIQLDHDAVVALRGRSDGILHEDGGVSLSDVGIKAPKGVLLFLASNINSTFLNVVASAIVDKYIGESARVIREMFAFARDQEPCLIFMDAIGGSRFSEGTSTDREIQRTLMELLNQMDGFESRGRVKMYMSTNRLDRYIGFSVVTSGTVGSEN
jgi:ATP-dependent 26S proteasome regulatory subunit